MNYLRFAREHDGKSVGQARPAWGTPRSQLEVSAPSDPLEREADQAAHQVSTGRKVPAWSLTKAPGSTLQRQVPPTPTANPLTPEPQPNNYAEGAGKLAEAFLQTPTGKALLEAVAADPLVKAAEGFIGTLPGKVITGTAAAGVVAAMAATHTALPAQIPAIPLDKLAPGLKVKITYEGPMDHPTKAMVTFSYTPKAEEKKPKQTQSEKDRAQNARVAAELEQFRGTLKYKTGSPEDLQQRAEQKMVEDWVARRFGSAPGTGGRPLVPAGLSLQPPTLESPSRPKAPTLLDRKLELKSLATVQTPAPSEPDAEKKEELPVQRKAEGKPSVAANAAAVQNVLHSPGRPLEAGTRRFMESRLGFDFSRVRVHTDDRAAGSAKELGASAYTVGGAIVFGAGQYSPGSAPGRQLLAHELAHVIQQGQNRAAPAGRVERKPGSTDSGI